MIRQARPEDAEACGRICYEAFYRIATQHNFPPDLPNPEFAVGVLSMLFSHPGIYAVVAEEGNKIVGSNALDERSAIAGVGPITVSPDTQNSSVGRQLMDAVLTRAADKRFPGVRLVQAAYHNRSLSLYTKLGFETREPLSCIQGEPLKKKLEGRDVRQATTADLEACNAVCARVHGHTREGELSDAIQQGGASVVEHNGRITGYSTGIAFFAHAVGETDDDLKALIADAEVFGGIGFLVPTRNGELLRWCFANGLRIVQPMTLMTKGLYNEPRGAYLPSIFY